MHAIAVILRFCEKVSFVCLAVLALAIIIQLALRNFFDYGHPGLEEVARCAHVSLVFLVIPQIFRAKKHIRIDLLVNLLPPHLMRYADGFSAVMTAIFCLFFLHGEYTFMIRNGNVPSPGLAIPNYLFFMGAYVGMTLLLLTAIEQIACLAAGKDAGEIR